jgi:hypothetical protein
MVFLATEFDAVVEPIGHTTKDAKAAFLGIPRPTFSKVANGKADPNNEFIARVWLALPKVAHRFFRAEVR